MTILLVSATELEIKPLLEIFQFEETLKPSLNRYSYKNATIDMLITGVGMTSTAFELGKVIAMKYDLAINVGIAGSFKRNIKIGEVVNVYQDMFSELGAQDNEHFISIFDLGLLDPNISPFTNACLINPTIITNPIVNQLRLVKGITVNKVHGKEESIIKLLSEFPDIETESMEGGAFMYACISEHVSFIQLRAISNYVEKRNKEAWNIPLAIKNLNTKVSDIIESLI